KAFNAVGRAVKVRRYSGLGSAQTYVEKTVLARVGGFAASEILPGVDQGRRQVMLLAEDLGAPITLPLVAGDKVVVDDVELEIEEPDADTRRGHGGVLLAYVVRVVG
ncbi:MAG: hypothetical protein J0H08_08785, partial [Rhizobiales bacterium]|nr:hypothetical protein [Hyphomicrobiales bacterium]